MIRSRLPLSGIRAQSPPMFNGIFTSHRRHHGGTVGAGLETSMSHKLDNGFTVSRRELLGGALGAGTLGALAACRGDGINRERLAGFSYISYLEMETLSVVAELMGDAGGFFEDHGLDVEFEVAQGSPQALQTLVSGVAPLTRVGAIDLITAVADGQELVNIGTIARGSAIRTVYHHEDPLKTPEDFIGKTMGVPSEGGTSDKSLSLMLLNAGIDPDDVDRQVVGLGPATFDLIRRQEIVGYMVSIDQAIQMEQEFPNEAGVFDTGFTVRADSQVYTATPQSLEEYGEHVENYMAAIYDALAYMLNAENDDILETLRSEYSFLSLDDDIIAPEALEHFRNLWTADGQEPLLTTNETYWAEGYEEMVAGDMAPEGYDPSVWVDNSYIPEASPTD